MLHTQGLPEPARPREAPQSIFVWWKLLGEVSKNPFGTFSFLFRAQVQHLSGGCLVVGPQAGDRGIGKTQLAGCLYTSPLAEPWELDADSLPGVMRHLSPASHQPSGVGRRQVRVGHRHPEVLTLSWSLQHTHTHTHTRVHMCVHLVPSWGSIRFISSQAELLGRWVVPPYPLCPAGELEMAQSSSLGIRFLFTD